MENPFESGHIKNYVLLYVSIVVIMVLFFIAATLFNEVEVFDKKIFQTDALVVGDSSVEVEEKNSTRFKLMDKAY